MTVLEDEVEVDWKGSKGGMTVPSSLALSEVPCEFILHTSSGRVPWECVAPPLIPRYAE
jgi:hypothetical protein